MCGFANETGTETSIRDRRPNTLYFFPCLRTFAYVCVRLRAFAYVCVRLRTFVLLKQLVEHLPEFISCNMNIGVVGEVQLMSVSPSSIVSRRKGAQRRKLELLQPIAFRRKNNGVFPLDYKPAFFQEGIPRSSE